MAQWKRVLVSLGVTIAIVLGLVLIPPQASALDVTLTGTSSVYKPNQICFLATLTFQNGEIIPISSLEAIITGATNVTIAFDIDGNVQNVTGDLTAAQIGASITKTGEYGYGYGYRTGYEDGHGYQFGYGYGYYAVDDVVSYQICISSRYLTLGDHQIQVKVSAEGDSVTGTFTSNAHQFRVRAAAPGGGGGGVPPAAPKLDVDLWGDVSSWDITDDGVLLEDVDATSPDGRVTIHIDEGTTVLGPDGEPLAEIAVTPVDPLPTPPAGYHVIAAFDFGPDNASFDPGIQITIAYDPEALPEGVDEANLVIAFRDETTGEWEFVTGVVDPDANTVTFSIDHFTVFAILAETVPTPTPTPTPTPPPVPTAINWWIWGWVIGGALIVAILVSLLAIRRARWGIPMRRLPRR